MEQQQYHYTENSGSVKKPENRFLRIWGPVLIKWGVGMGVSMLAMMIYMPDASRSAGLAAEAAEELMRYATPIEGIAAFLTIPILLVMFHQDTIKEKLLGLAANKKASLWKYAAILVMTAAMTLGLNNLIELGGLMKVSEEYEDTMNSLYAAPFPMQILCLGILIPICEELVFRGLMFRRLRQGGTFMAAALYSSFVFGFLHVNMVQMLYGFILGFTFCYLYEKYGSVKAPVFAHIVSNILSVVLTEFHAMEWMSAKPIRIGTITVACASAASAMYVLIQRIEEQLRKMDITV